MIYIGIDPGQTGAMATIDGSNIRIYDFDDGACINVLEDLYLYSLAGREPIVYIEQVHSMPQQGVSSTFKFGTNYGIWQGRIEMVKFPLHFVTPQTWKKVMLHGSPKLYKHIKGEKVVDGKKMGLAKARQLFPNAAGQYLTRVKDHNRAEALLIAEYGRITNK